MGQAGTQQLDAAAWQPHGILAPAAFLLAARPAELPPLAPRRPSLPIPPAGATLGSFLIALLHFAMELLLFKTMGLATALQPMIVAGAPLMRDSRVGVRGGAGSGRGGQPCSSSSGRH